MSGLRVGVWQCSPVGRDRIANLARLDAVAAEASSRGAGLLITPELALTGYDVGDVTDLVRDDDADRLAAVADRHRVALVVGLAAYDADGSLGNEALTIDRDGTVLSCYRKAHLFGDLDRSRFEPGATPFALAEIEGVRVATMICYDVEFPEAVREAALAGAHLVAVPTANMVPFEIVAEQLVRIRAWENQVYLAYANHCGYERSTTYVGRSSLTGPDGRPLAAAPADGEHLLVADVEPAVVERGRAENPYLSDRRADLYGHARESR